MDVNYQTYDRGNDILLAACDDHVLGKTLEDGDIQLEVKESFYAGKKIGIDGLKKKLKTCTIANLVGQTTVKAAIEMGFGSEDDVMKIDGVPHLQIIRI